MTVFENRVIVDVISQNGTILQQGGRLIQNDWCPYNKADRRRQGHHGKLGAEAGLVQLQA